MNGGSARLLALVALAQAAATARRVAEDLDGDARRVGFGIEGALATWTGSRQRLFARGSAGTQVHLRAGGDCLAQAAMAFEDYARAVRRAEDELAEYERNYRREKEIEEAAVRDATRSDVTAAASALFSDPAYYTRLHDAELEAQAAGRRAEHWADLAREAHRGLAEQTRHVAARVADAIDRLVPGGASLSAGDLALQVHRQSGHRTGSTKRAGVRVDDAALLGSPGAGTRHRSDLHVPAGHLYIDEADHDPVADAVGGIAPFGGDPSHLSGVTFLENHDARTPLGTGKGITGHTSYLDDKTTSQYNLAMLAAGMRDDLITTHAPPLVVGDRLTGDGLSLVTKTAKAGASGAGHLAEDAVTGFGRSLSQLAGPRAWMR